MLKVLLIDDEEIALDVLEILLLEVGEITIVGKFQLVEAAIKAAAELKPDIVFLDIEMPGTNGLNAVELLLNSCPDSEIIFVTAHNQYAVEAFETNAIGYLLKPVNKDRLIKTLVRVKNRSITRISAPLDAAAGAAGSNEEGVLQLKVLGSLELYDPAGKLVTWRTKKTKELFAYLWSAQEAPVNRYHIMEYLWPEMDSERTQTLLHTTLYNIRSLLKSIGLPKQIEFRDERYYMRTSFIKSDLDQLEGIMKENDSLDKHGELLSLYRGDLLEMEYYSWAENRRFDLRKRYIQHLSKLSRKAEGTVRELLLRKLLELDPYNEEWYEQLLQDLKGIGDTTGYHKLLMTKKEVLEENS